MQRLITLLIIAALGWYGYTKYQGRVRAQTASTQESRESPIQSAVERPKTESPNSSAYKCDGRTYCSQMTSCEEAKFFLKNCPGVKMDGDGNGIPCEKQWCTR